MEFCDVIKKRKSVRNYSDENVSDEDLKKIAKAGQIAPRAGEFQLTFIQNKELINKINNCALEVMKNSDNEFLKERAAIPGYQPLYGAPVIILLSAPDENVYGNLTVACAAENMILTATNLGLGSCFMVTPTLSFMSYKKEELLKELSIPKGFNPLCGIAIGKAGSEKMALEEDNVDNLNFVK
jgi:FMN reductase [NAD(P)H]